MSEALSLFMQVPRGMEWVFIIIIAVVVFFGAKKIPELARTFGKAGAEYEKARVESKRELKQLMDSGNADREKLEDVAETLGIGYANKSDDELRAAIESQLRKDNK